MKRMRMMVAAAVVGAMGIAVGGMHGEEATTRGAIASTRKSIKVGREPFVEAGAITVTTKLMDPEKGLKPAEYHGEQGACETKFTSGFAYKTELPKVRQEGKEFVASLKVMSPAVKVNLAIVLWLPEKADATLVDHEETHRAIAEKVYAEGVVKLSEFVKGLNNKVFEARGESKEAATKAVKQLVVDTYNAEFQRVMPGREGKLNKAFDEVSKHGVDQSKSAAEWMAEVLKAEK